ncbi:hypothetical protein Pfo_012007, partial [Paulownia fortunei]
MAGLQRSAVSFRRQGSSGLVWDDKLLSGELNQLANQQKENKKNKPQQVNKEDDAAAATNSLRAGGLKIERSRSNGGRGFRTGKVSPAIEPPSPKVSACGFCSAFGKNNKTRRLPPKSGKRDVHKIKDLYVTFNKIYNHYFL